MLLVSDCVTAAERAVSLIREHAALAQRSIDVVRTRFEVGEADLLEVNLAPARLLDIRVEIENNPFAFPIDGERFNKRVAAT